MIQEVRTYSLLTGNRGEEAVDIDALVNALLRLNQLIMDFPQIHELDINSLIVKTKGTVAHLENSRNSKLKKFHTEGKKLFVISSLFYYYFSINPLEIS